MQAKLSLIAFACSVAMTSSASAQFMATTSIVWDASTPLTLASDLLDNLAPGTSYRLYPTARKVSAPLLDAAFALPNEGTPTLTLLRPPPLSAPASVALAQPFDVGPGELERYIPAVNTFSFDPSAPREARRDLVARIVRPWLSFDTSSGRK